MTHDVSSAWPHTITLSRRLLLRKLTSTRGNTLSPRFATHWGPTVRSVEQVTAVSLELLRDINLNLTAYRVNTGRFPVSLFNNWAGRIRTCGIRDPNSRVLPLDDGPKKKPKNISKR